VPRQSLFSAVTGHFRRRQAAGMAASAEQPATLPARREPAMTDGPRPSVRQATSGDEVGLEIPAFLRRQSS